jgi:hypothetical protein
VCPTSNTVFEIPWGAVFSEVHEERAHDPSIGERRVNFLGRLVHRVV